MTRIMFVALHSQLRFCKEQKIMHRILKANLSQCMYIGQLAVEMLMAARRKMQNWTTMAGNQVVFAAMLVSILEYSADERIVRNTS